MFCPVLAIFCDIFGQPSLDIRLHPTATTPCGAVIIIPGGGYGGRATDHEGYQVNPAAPSSLTVFRPHLARFLLCAWQEFPRCLTKNCLPDRGGGERGGLPRVHPAVSRPPEHPPGAAARRAFCSHQFAHDLALIQLALHSCLVIECGGVAAGEPRAAAGPLPRRGLGRHPGPDRCAQLQRRRPPRRLHQRAPS